MQKNDIVIELMSRLSNPTGKELTTGIGHIHITIADTIESELVGFQKYRTPIITYKIIVKDIGRNITTTHYFSVKTKAAMPRLMEAIVSLYPNKEWNLAYSGEAFQ